MTEQVAYRVKVPMPVTEDKKKVMEEVQLDRKHAIDAAIVRIMKSRKSLEHQQLTAQTMQQVHPARAPAFSLSFSRSLSRSLTLSRSLLLVLSNSVSLSLFRLSYARALSNA